MCPSRYSGPAVDRPAVLSDLLDAGLARDPDADALVCAEFTWSWRTLDRVTRRLAESYRELGLRPGDRLASLMPNRPRLIAHYIACFRAGLVATPLNYRYTVDEIDHALELSGARALLAHNERDDELAGSRLAGGLDLARIGYPGGGSDGVSLDQLMEGEPAAVELPTPDPSHPAVVFFTSGSTGPPKGVTHTHETLGWMLAIAAAGLELTPDDRLLAGSSLSHVGAFYVSFGALSAGACSVIARSFDGDELLPLLRGSRPTVLSMLPSALFALTRDHGAGAADFGSLRLCRAAGDCVSAELEREFADLTGLVIDEAYGLTETGLVSVSPPSGDIRVGSVGLPAPGVAMEVRGEHGDPLAAGEEGRVWIRTPAATVGYWQNDQATADAFRDGWLDSGDVMRADDNGYLYFCGRRKQIIVHDGSNITPQVVEGALVEHPCVESAGVVGVHDLVHGENVRAYVELREGAERPAVQELIQFARDRVGYKAPEEVVFLEQMPRTASGKVDRSRLKRMAATRSSAAIV
ncbi:MAG TPA: class I adenylate-forming enzyme family protein [Gaiellales bacterium]|jgi:acyl-CoA synthetase (AMP-forming)/AMP-acid ligase II|nr:class I adenylate-forming enzyme family protein [Gaiellales bacterium]